MFNVALGSYFIVPTLILVGLPLLCMCTRWGRDRVVSLYHAVFLNKGFTKAIEYYQFLANVEQLKTPTELIAKSLNDKSTQIEAIEKHNLSNEGNVDTSLFIIKGDYGSITEMLVNKGYQVELVNPANSRVPGGAVRRHIGTLDEHLSRYSTMQDKIRFMLYKKINALKNQSEKEKQLKVLDTFYGLSDKYVELAKKGQLNNLSWRQRASMVYEIVLAERALIHSNLAKIDPGEYERNNNVLMWTKPKNNNPHPVVVDCSHIVAPDLRWMTGYPYYYKPFPFIGSKTTLKYEKEVKQSFRLVIQQARNYRMLVLPAFGCGAFLGEPSNFSKILISVLGEPEIASLLKQKNIQICLGLIGEPFNKISKTFKESSASKTVRSLSERTFPVATKPKAAHTKDNNKPAAAVLIKYQHKLKEIREKDLQTPVKVAAKKSSTQKRTVSR